MDPSPNCPLCHGVAPFAFEAGDRFYQVTASTVRLHRCIACKTLFQWPVPSREELAGFYPRGYWQEKVKPSLLTRLQEIYIQMMLRLDLMGWVRRLGLQKGDRYIDIGCSRGDWLALIRDQGLAVQGIEADPRAAAFARTRYGLSIEEVDGDQWDPQPNQFDAISFFHLLEHLRDPKSFLQKCRLALKPGGQILLRIPNICSLQSRLCGQGWKGLEMPRHVFLPSPQALKRQLRETGFRVVKRSTWSLRDGPSSLSSSVFPRGEPTRQQILGKSRPFMTLVYLGLTWLVAPLEALFALVGRGAMITVVAKVDK